MVYDANISQIPRKGEDNITGESLDSSQLKQDVSGS
jgi:hypothetical protein